MPAQISPVCAPKLCSLIFCAPSRIFFVSRIAFETASSAVNGGQTTTSASFRFFNSSFRSFTKASASAMVLFIFQLPAMINFLSLVIFQNFQRSHVLTASLIRQGGNAGQNGALQEFQAC